jgi:predicted CXXCH cytochrome family protein
MKRVTSMALGLILVAAAPALGQDIAGTLHDFTSTGPGAWTFDTGTDYCVICHSPHNNRSALAADSLLWNHNLNEAQAYVDYSSLSLDGAMNGVSGRSLLCLSCHDGVFAVNDYGVGAGAGAADENMTARGDLGTDLSQSHPVGIVYDTGADPGLNDPAATTYQGATTIDAHLIGGGDGVGTVECSTCHDPHNNDNLMFLKVTNASSAICVTCHIK